MYDAEADRGWQSEAHLCSAGILAGILLFWSPVVEFFHRRNQGTGKSHCWPLRGPVHKTRVGEEAEVLLRTAASSFETRLWLYRMITSSEQWTHSRRSLKLELLGKLVLPKTFPFKHWLHLPAALQLRTLWGLWDGISLNKLTNTQPGDSSQLRSSLVSSRIVSMRATRRESTPEVYYMSFIYNKPKLMTSAMKAWSWFKWC